MPKYCLGQKVHYRGIMRKFKRSGGRKWENWRLSGDGIIVGKRTVSDGYSRYHPDEGNVYCSTKHHSFWLVAHNLTGYRYIAEEDIEPCQES